MFMIVDRQSDTYLAASFLGHPG